MTPPLHVTHIVYRFATGGLENGIVNLINHLPSDRYRHSIICLNGWDPEFAARLQQPVHIESLDKKPGPDWKYYLPLWRAVRRLRPDLVHTRNLATLEYQIPCFLAGVKHRVHGEHGWDMSDLDGNNTRFIALKKSLKPLIHDFIALSGQSQTYLVERVGVTPRHCHQIINGVDTERFTPEGPRAKPPHTAFKTSCSLVFGCVGRMASVKNHRLLAEAFIALCRSHPERAHDLRLVIVGGGEHYEAITKQLTDAGLADQVWLPGDQQDIPSFMRLFDVFVLPSLTEGISNTILEALSSGLPVIATDVGGNRELVEPGKTGNLTARGQVDAMASTMAEYLHHPELIVKHGTQARHAALTNFSLAKMVDRYDAVYSNKS